ncbi:gliding motility-associated C-terminal domain-containing protein [Chitinophaga eiseniae]|uniref:Gliding motility-associated C-terminal domain-containing protein n=1 Tax=Chitinophaga eiseniae TaxID=634771 RepID=A0A1T4L4N8_9BACT|nr:PKD domain-containing protein [Chitinophaga eiseniae]SJZ49527.1 gliding motility-associated C-terminal domain-containing protein [Chitinophaga eiseniae]
MFTKITNHPACQRLQRCLMAISVLVLQFVAFSSHAQNLSNKGKDFWVGYGHHQFMEPGGGNSQEMILYLSAEQAATVTVSITGTAWTRTYTIPANTVIATDLIPKTGANDARLYSPPPSFGGTGGEGTFNNKSIHIHSNVPIVAYAHIFGSASSGATMLMPEETWGYSYISVNSQQDYASDCFSWMFVVANQNNTVVEITPSVLTRNGRAPGVPFTVTLNRGDIYQLVGGALAGSKGRELTGTTVKSIGNSAGECYPVAVFSGSSRTSQSCTNSGGSGDNNIQQVFPFQAWGKRYLTAPYSHSGTPTSNQTSMYKVVVKDPATVVKKNGAVMGPLIANSYYEYNSNTADYIEADKPVLVAQYMPSSGSCGNNDPLGDPEMVYLSPIEQAVKRTGFYRNNREFITVNYLTLIIPTGGIGSLLIDGSPLFNTSYPHPNLTGYSVVVKRWTAAQAQCIVTSDSAFTATTYGLGSVESYGYNAGTLINNLNAVGSIHNEYDTSKATNDFTCTQTPVQLSILMAYKPTKMVWKLSLLGAAITPNADVTVNAPVPVATVVINGITYYKYTLPGSYKFTNTGEFDITVMSTHPSIENCTNTEKVGYTISVKPKPRAISSYAYSGCTLDSAIFKGENNQPDYKIDRWKWEFPGPALDSGIEVHHAFLPGQANVKLTVISADGCVGDTSFQVKAVAKPVANFTSDVPSLCEGAPVKLTDNSTYGGTTPLKEWYWDFGNDSVKKATTNAPESMTYDGHKTYTIKHMVKVSDLCISDTITKTITVYAKPHAAFTFPGDCLPVNGVVQFSSTATVPDAQTLTGHSWDFGDAGATPANPNTSLLPSPTHAYTKFGTYTIKYQVTTDKGCTKDTTITASFKLKPQLAYAPVNGICVNVKGSIKVANAAVQNGVTGKGYYKGPATDSSGNFTPSAAGAGTHKIWYVFNTSTGCSDSVATDVVVYPKPTATFTATANVCLGQPALITDQSTITGGVISTWKWDDGKGQQTQVNNNTPFNVLYTADGSYTVKLVAVSDHQCLSDTASMKVGVHPLPEVNFQLPASICMPEGSAQFTNLSKIKDNSALTWKWNFGDGSAASALKDPLHNYTAYGPFDVVLAATSPFGCADSATKRMEAFFGQPVASFKVSPDTLCQGTDNTFTDQSTDAKSNITTWAWEFGDGSTSSAQNPVKKYTEPGEYGVKLKVSNAAGCTSAPFTSKVVVYLQPVIDAGQSFVVPQGTVITFRPTANDSVNLKFRWEPAADFPNPTLLSPSIPAMHDEVYTLTATGKHNCTAKDQLSVKVLKPVLPPNAFSPNGDNINDKWVIYNLSDYPDSKVEVFNRYGQRVYQSTGYPQPWDGSFKGNPLPVGTYYYVITLRNGFAPLSGYVAIIR